MTDSRREVWLRGPLPEFDPLLMPVAHALMQVREDLERLAREVPDEHAWATQGRAASIGFHVMHVGGSLDRLLTYARAEMLDEQQRAALAAERTAGESRVPLPQVTAATVAAIDRALDQVKHTPAGTLLEPRAVGRAGMPSTVLGLLVHAAEHATRHVGQAITTARMLARP